MIVRVVLNKRLLYGYRILPKLLDRSPVMIAQQWIVTTHSEVSAAGRSVEEHDWSNDSSKRITNKEFRY